MSDAVTHFMGPHVGGCYVTDVVNFTGRGDIFTEHKRRVSMVLMIVFKYLMGQFFFLMARFGAVNTFAHQERNEVKGLKGASPRG